MNIISDRNRIDNIVHNDVLGRVVLHVEGKGFIISFYNWVIKPDANIVEFAPSPSIVYVIRLEFLTDEQISKLKRAAQNS